MPPTTNGTPEALPPRESPPTAGAPASSAGPDFDGDGRADLAAVISAADDGEAYRPRVWYGSGELLDVSGTAPLARDLNADGYSDLLTGWGDQDSLGVQVWLGSPDGLHDSGRRLRVLTGNRAVGARVRSIALVESPTPHLAVGIAQAAGPGEVRVVPLSTSGLPDGEPVTLAAGRTGVPGFAEEGTFGTTLATAGNQLFIAVPGAEVGGHPEAGAVVVVTFVTSGPGAIAVLSQATPGVGTAGAGHRFGEGLAAGDDRLVVGAPGDADGEVAASGSVEVFGLGGSEPIPLQRLTQGSPAVPGVPEAGDRFGTAVAVANVCPGSSAVVVGGPGEDVAEPDDDAGSVWVLPRPGSGCPARQLYAGHGLGDPPSGAGGLLAVLRAGDGRLDDLLIGSHGSFSEGPTGRITRWSPTSRQPVFTYDVLLDHLAGC